MEDTSTQLMAKAAAAVEVFMAVEAAVQVYTVRGLTAQKAPNMGIGEVAVALEALLGLQEHLIQETTVVVLVAVLGGM